MGDMLAAPSLLPIKNDTIISVKAASTVLVTLSRSLTNLLFCLVLGDKLVEIISKSCSGYVYLIAAIGTPRYKIGRSKNPAKRLEELNQQSCYPLRLLETCYFDDCEYHEKRIHKLLKQWRVHGEWFEIPSTYLKCTNMWFHEPTCSHLKIINKHQIVVYSGKHETRAKEIYLDSLKLDELGINTPNNFRAPKDLKIPTDIEEIKRACVLLGIISKLELNQWSYKVKAELVQLLGKLPFTTQDAVAWKSVFKQLYKVTTTNNLNKYRKD